jgi:NADH-quinone oxidoreductase subunit M
LVERGPALPGALLLNGHWGALLILKLLVIWPAGIEPGRPVLICLAPISALYIALRALGERSPRQLLALVTLGQSAVIVGGLALAGAEGPAGAFLAWADIAVTSVALLLIVRLLEVRFGEDLSASRHLGLAGHAPRLAVYFVILALALVGLPGTLGFWAQDMIIHAMAGSHLWLGLVLMTATGLNAVSVFRLFTRLLLGRRRTGITIMADALPGERWVLAAAVLWVVLGGLFPRAVLWAGRSPRSGGARPASTDAKRPLRHHGGDWRSGAAALTVAPPAP